MTQTKTDIRLPDLGGAADVQIIEILVQPGAQIEQEQPLLVLEGDKATMEVPSPFAGSLLEWCVQVGDTVNSNDLVATMMCHAPSTQTTVPSTEPETTTQKIVDTEVTKVIDICLPDLGGAQDVQVIEVLVQSGDAIELDQALIVLEGDKATMEVPAAQAGTIVSVDIEVGKTVNAGDVIGQMAITSADTVGDLSAQNDRTEQSIAAIDRPVSDSGIVAEPVVEPGNISSQPIHGALVYAGPSVRRLAFEFGVELSQVKASGPKGRLLKKDLQQFVKARLQGFSGGASALPTMPEIDFSQFGSVRTEPLSKIQQKSAEFLARNALLIPHVTQHDYVDITALEALRQSHKKGYQDRGARLTMLVFVMRGLVESMKAFPHFNASLAADGKHIIMKDYIHIGFAVDTPNGLVVPVIRDVDTLSVFELAQAIVSLSAKAREGQLTPADMQGGCMTVSSLGGIGGRFFTPIINAPEVAILGLSKAVTQPVYDGSTFQPKLMLPLSLSYDHRVIDGADGARFLNHFGEHLQAQVSLCQL